MWAASGRGRQILVDAAASRFSEAGPSTLPLRTDDGAQPSPDPLVKAAQH